MSFFPPLLVSSSRVKEAHKSGVCNQCLHFKAITFAMFCRNKKQFLAPLVPTLLFQIVDQRGLHLEVASGLQIRRKKKEETKLSTTP